MEAIQSATVVPARFMKMDKEIGTIESGKQADLIITGGNPLESISNIRSVKFVMTNGKIYETEKLWKSIEFRP